MSDAQPPAIPPEAQKPKRGRWMNIALWIIWGPFLVLAVLGIFVGIAEYFSDKQKQAEAQQTAQRRRQPMSGVAVFMDVNFTMFICARTDLHDCVVRYGQSNSVDTVVRVPMIHAVPTCEQQRRIATSTCETRSNEPYFITTPAGERCLSEFGMVPLLDAPTSDPRDPSVGNKRATIECAEGTYSGLFE